MDKTPIELFIDWAETQDERIMETIAFQILFLDEDVNEQLAFSAIRPFEKLKTSLLALNKVPKKVGKLIFIKTAIDFLTRKYGDIDVFLDHKSQSKQHIEEEEAKGYDMTGVKEFYSRQDGKFEQGKLFKDSWTEFSEKTLSFHALDEWLINDMLSKRR